MKFAGIIAEYDPFHNGHAWQLAQAKALGAERVAVAMSCSLVQRGALPLLPEAVRTRSALTCGADLVFALPAPCACAGAEAFARAGVALLAAAGSFAVARQAAAAKLASDERVAALLDKPNNNLAVEYCRAIRSLSPRMEAYPLPRQGANHGEALHSAHGQFASASALRKLWAEGGADAVAPYVPEAVFPLYQEAYAAGQYTDFSAAGRCELALLRSACRGKTPFADIRGISEGLEHRLEAAVRTSTTYDELLDALTTVRYPRARMRRLAMDAALGCTADSLPALPPYLHLLGGKKDALPLLKNCTLPVSHSLARLRGSGDASARMAEAQLAAADFGTLCRVSPEAMGGLLRQKNIFLM